MKDQLHINQEKICQILQRLWKEETYEICYTHSHGSAKGRLHPDQMSSAIHLIRLTSYQPTFFYSTKGKPPTGSCQDIKDFKKNPKTELDAVSSNAFNDCCVQLLEIHTVKEDFNGKENNFNLLKSSSNLTYDQV
jgi:hypothetical protein